MAAFMLATLISTLFALPAIANNPMVTTNAGSAPVVLPGAAYSYGVVVTNDGTADTSVIATGSPVNATAGVVSYVLSGTPGVVPCVGTAPYVCTAANMASNETMTITVNVTAGVAGPASNSVSVVSTNTPLAPAPVVANTTVQNADLVVTKTHTGATTPGGALAYTITVKNNGPSDATNVTLNDTAPANVTFGAVTVVSATPVGITACNPAPTATTIACLFPSIVSGQTVTLTVPATLAAAATVGSSIANTASTSTSTLDATTPNTVTDTFVVGAASVDLGVTLTVLPTTAAPGDTVTYTVTVSNPNTTTDATNVVVTDVLPAGLAAVTPPTTPSAGTAAVAANTWTWTIPTVVKATSATTPTVVTTSFTATVDEATTLTTITNTVTMTATQTDPVSTNNTASVGLTIVAAVADLNVVSSVDDSKPNQGDTIKIYVRVSNAGPADATNIVLKDVLPTGLKYVSCEPTPCEQTGLRRQSSQLFSIPLVAANDAGTIVLSVVVQASQGTLQNNASVVSLDQSDPTGANNQDSLNITIAGTANNPGTGGTGSGSGGTSGSGGNTAFTGFTANELMPWLMLFATLGLVALEYARRRPAFAAIGHTYGFDPWV
jgi:uncharacterized repeat protein (TIGR01451 family)